ncbi:NAD(P)-dependent oxidoreductase [Nocardia pseudovaccinii]|uniref:NAD(P)-dependent oxidoreductase n=1 Tax=Nocardia pseudovaccinii TaxID=189540 RepID=UPI0007A3F3C5|nr:NAD(P)-binding domain-containing protein [Nocardia pseudovaccinii]
MSVLPTIGFLGAGRIGEPMAQHLLAAGHRVRLYTRRAEVGDRLTAAGAELVDRVGDIADADVVVSCLFSDAQMLEVLPEIVGAMRAETILISHTTGTPTTLSRLDEFAPSGKAAIVDGPFSGTADSARAGRLVVYLGGVPEHVATARQVVRAYADPVITTGARGTAMLMKLLNNLLFATISQVTLRGLAAGRAVGIEDSALLEALAVSAGGSNAGRHIAAVGSPDQYTETVRPFLRKDLAACREVAAEVGVDLSELLAIAYAGPMDLGEISTLENGVVR